MSGLKQIPASFPNQEIITRLLVKRTNAERQEIKKAFKRRYKEDLVIKLELGLSGSFQDAIVALMTPQSKFYARELHYAVAGLGTDENAICEIMGPMNRTEFVHMAAVYKKVYGTSLKDDLVDDTSGFFRQLLVELCDGKRERFYGIIDREVAYLDASELKYKLHMTDHMEEALIRILTTRSFPQLNATFEEYRSMANTDFRKHFRMRIFDELYYGLSAIIESVISPSDYFAAQLEQSMLGIGTNNRQLIRLVVGRSERDLGDIKIAYEKKYGVTLIDRITRDTSGLYQYLLCSLVNQS